MARRFRQLSSAKLHTFCTNPSESGLGKVSLVFCQSVHSPNVFFSATSSPPFRITEEGWGEFDMQIILTAVEKGGDHTIVHDLNFQSNQYEAKHVVVSRSLPSRLHRNGTVSDARNFRPSRIPNRTFSLSYVRLGQYQVTRTVAKRARSRLRRGSDQRKGFVTRCPLLGPESLR